MKRTLKQTLLTAPAIVLAAISLAPAAQAAGTATLSFSPSSGTVDNGNILSVGIYENSGSDSINTVQANFSYPDSLLSCYGSSPISSSSAFGVDAQDVCGGGSVKIGRGAFTPVTGNQLVATVYFQALAGSGTASLNFDSSSSMVVRSTDHQKEALTVQNSSYNLSTPVPNSSPSPSPSPSPPVSGGTSSKGGGSAAPSSRSSSTSSGSSAGSASTGTSSSAAAPAQLTITNVAVSNISSDTATVTWQTSVPATSEVDYGPTNAYGLSAVSSQLTTNHSLKLNSNELRSSLVYHFVVKSVDAQGHASASPDRIFETAGGGPLQAGSQTGFYLKIALAAVGVIIIIAIAAAWYIRRLHAAALLEHHVVHTNNSTSAALPPGDMLITPHSPPADNSDDDKPPLGPVPPPVG